jgi:hypothetical protein
MPITYTTIDAWWGLFIHYWTIIVVFYRQQLAAGIGFKRYFRTTLFAEKL